MVQRLTTRENEKPENARKRFDGRLGVRNWTTPGTQHTAPKPRDPKAPWWWDGAEDASQSFLTAMGVTLA
jgi:hypothetical protein